MNFWKKSLITTVLAFAMLGHVLFMSSFALEQSDLVSQAIPYLYAAPSEGEGRIDGIRSLGEYSDPNEIVFANAAIPFAVSHDMKTKGDFQIYLSYDSEFVRIAVKFGDRALLKPISFDGKNAYSFTIKMGLNPSFPEALSYLENTYFFSVSDFSCLAVLGTRVLFSTHEKSFVGSISSLTPETERPYREDDIVWNAEKYQAEAALVQASGSEETLFECRIPWGDLLQTTSNSSLPVGQDNISAVCGGFSFETNFENGFGTNSKAFLCGISSSYPCPLAQEDLTWREYLSELSGLNRALIPETLMLPLYFANHPIQSADPPPVSGESQKQPDTDKTIGNDRPTSDQASLDEKPPNTTGDPFQNLPQVGEKIPEQSEVKYVTTKKSQTQEGDTLGSTLLLIAGIFLFVSVLGTAILFRMLEQKEKIDKEKKKSSKKS